LKLNSCEGIKTAVKEKSFDSIETL
jgi:hypothetical protein